MESITSGNFTFTKTSIEGVIIVDAKAYGDERGYFMETYNLNTNKEGRLDEAAAIPSCLPNS